MKPPKIILLIFVLLLSSFATRHKYYTSVTKINYVESEKSVQIISRIFIDDLEKVLRKRYDESIILSHENSKTVQAYLQKYIKTKFRIAINGVSTNVDFIGVESDNNIIKCYLEISNVKSVDSIAISNKILFDLFEEQQNIIKLDINGKNKSYILTYQNAKMALNFN